MNFKKKSGIFQNNSIYSNTNNCQSELRRSTGFPIFTSSVRSNLLDNFQCLSFGCIWKFPPRRLISIAATVPRRSNSDLLCSGLTGTWAIFLCRRRRSLSACTGVVGGPCPRSSRLKSRIFNCSGERLRFEWMAVWLLLVIYIGQQSKC